MPWLCYTFIVCVCSLHVHLHMCVVLTCACVGRLESGFKLSSLVLLLVFEMEGLSLNLELWLARESLRSPVSGFLLPGFRCMQSCCLIRGHRGSELRSWCSHTADTSLLSHLPSPVQESSFRVSALHCLSCWVPASLGGKFEANYVLQTLGQFWKPKAECR